MEDKELLRRLSIALMDRLSTGKRTKHIADGTPVRDVMRIERQDYSFSNEAQDFVDCLSRNPDTGLLWYFDRDYPSFEGMTSSVPMVLMYKGNRPDFSRPAAAIVGTRKATWGALHQAFKLGMECAGSGISVVTGLAEGIDRAASEGAVAVCEHLGTKVPAIGALGSGIETNYPSFTADLKRRIVECGGCIITREAPHAFPMKHTFPKRNMVIAAVSDFTVAVQAPERSGTLITADFTLQAGKDVFVASSGTDDSLSSVGTARLAQDGAPVISSICEATGVEKLVIEKAHWNENGCVRYHDLCYKVRLI